MCVSVVPVIYDSETKQVLRWFVLDFDYQLSDPAFNPESDNEKKLLIPMSVYSSFGRKDGVPALHEIQAYVSDAVQ